MRVSPSLLRGVEFGSPEYVRITKHGEKRAEVTQAIDELDEAVANVVRLLPHMSDEDFRIVQGILLAEIY